VEKTLSIYPAPIQGRNQKKYHAKMLKRKDFDKLYICICFAFASLRALPAAAEANMRRTALYVSKYQATIRPIIYYCVSITISL
jgi:hypothetical protein